MNKKKKAILKKIIEDVEDSTKILKETKDYVVKTSLKLENVSESIDRTIWDGKYMKESLDLYDKRPEIYKNDLFDDHLDFLKAELSGIADYTQGVLSKVKKSYDDISYLSMDLSQSSVNMGSGAIGVHSFYREFKKANPTTPINIKNPEENPYRKKRNLDYRIKIINPNLASKLSEISKSMSIISKMKHLSDAAHQMREFISHFLQLCDPNNEVKNKKWVEYSNKGNVKQKSRTTYAIIGSNPSIGNLNPIIAIAKKYRKLYKNLNGYAHLREGILTPKRSMLINTYYSQLLEYTEIILDLRDLYFKPKPH